MIAENDSIPAKKCTNELYLSEDILQGEKIPFYLIWSDNNVEKIKLEFEGFKQKIKLYNVNNYEQTQYNILITSKDLKSKGYIGGVLSTKLGNTPKEYAYLKAVLEYADGSSKNYLKERNLYSTRALLSSYPNKIDLSIKKKEKPIIIKLKGITTIIIEIKKMPRGLDLTFQPEVLSAFERFSVTTINNINKLKIEFPQYENEISTIIDLTSVESYFSYMRQFEKIINKLKKDKSVMEALYYAILSALLSYDSLRDSVLLPLMEYMESNATSKAFLNSPFLCVKVPVGGGRLRCRLIFYDLLNHKCSPSLKIDTYIFSNEERLVQLKEIIQFERSMDENAY
jgi:hypothetical protein